MLHHKKNQPELPQRVIILGAGGFVSGAVQKKLEALSIPVLALPRKDLDLTKTDAATKLAEFIRPNDAVIFVSAKAPVKNEQMLIDNLLMAKTVCEAVKQSSPEHLIYISSDAVYADSDQPLTESSPAQPASLHGVMHLAREVMLANAYQGSLCILRPTLIYGENDPHNGYGPNKFLRLAKAGENIQLFGNGEEKRDHVWVEDVAEIITLSLLSQSEGVLNIVSGEVVSFSEIANKIASISSNQISITNLPRVGKMPHNGYRAFDNANTYLAFPQFKYKSLLTMLEMLW